MADNPIVEELGRAIIEGEADAAVEHVRAALASGIDPMMLLNNGLMKSADEVGRLFEQGEYFLPELMLTGRALKAAMDVLKPELAKTTSENAPRTQAKIIIATIQSDIHDLDKNMVASMLMAAGFDVTDLGVDVPLKSIIDKAEETGANVIAVSALLTTSMPFMRDLIEMLKSRGLRQKYTVIVGGASVTADWARNIGADGTTTNAVEAVRLVRTLLDIN